uniref:Uncharacterized protein n=1 Tax=Anopheles epiroticus TaxID=199890 RepID=A0A182PCM9_9DIPT
ASAHDLSTHTRGPLRLEDRLSIPSEAQELEFSLAPDIDLTGTQRDETGKMGPVDKRTPVGRLVGVTMCLVLLTASVVQTGPVIRSRRMIREIYVENSAASPMAQENASSEIPSSTSGNSNGKSLAVRLSSTEHCAL